MNVTALFLKPLFILIKHSEVILVSKYPKMNSKKIFFYEFRYSCFLYKIPKIVNVPVPLWFNWIKKDRIFILILLHTVSKIGMYGLLYILTYSLQKVRKPPSFFCDSIWDLPSDKKPLISLNCIEDKEKNFSQGAKQTNHSQISTKSK